RAHQGDQRVVAGASLSGGQPLVPNAGEYFGLRDARGRGLPTLKRTLDAWTALGGVGGAGFAAIDPGDPKARALRAFGVRDILTFRGAPAPPDSRKLYSGIDGDVYAIGHTTPRAFVTCRWRTATEGSAVGVLQTAAPAQLEQDPLVEK